jgi:hypothetical protein
MHSTRSVALAKRPRNDRPAILPVGSPEQRMSLGEKDGQREAQPFVLYRLGVDWRRDFRL